MMKPILVIGHPQSGFARVEALLNACGMQKPLPSRREGFSPIEISEILRKAYLTSQATDQAPEIQQIEPGSIWHGMALDLMLGNLDQELWGWADPQSIHLLDYWKSLDPKITFILVYNEPQTVFTGWTDGNKRCTQEDLEAEMKLWCAFNAALLNFYYRNPGRCLLVHAQQVGLSANRYLQQVQARIEIPLTSPQHLPGQTESDVESEEDLLAADLEDVRPHDQHLTPIAANQEIQAWESESMAAEVDPLSQYLAGDLIGFFPEAQQIYEELQSVANLPLARDPNAKQSPLAAWKLMADLHQQLKQHEASTREYLEKLQALSEQKAQLEQQLSTLGLEKRVLGESQTGLQQENELLLLQLHQVQEELEQHYLTAQSRLENLNQVEKQKQAAEDQAKEHEASTRKYLKELQVLSEQKAQVEQQLSTLGLEKRVLGESQTELQQENELLLLQLHQVQEELEQYYLTAQSHLESLNQVEKQKQAAEAQAKEFEQKVAQTAAAKVAAENLVTEIKKKQARLTQDLGAQTTLAAERAKLLEEAHKAGNQTASNELKEENELLLLQLHQVQDELEHYYLENQQLKQHADSGNTSQQANSATALQPAVQKSRYGAAERVKQELSYRLGAAMVANHNSLKGWVNMPFALSREVRAFKHERKEKGEQELPPIDSYYDAHEAERVKEHLSYRLGAAMMAHHKSPIGWMKMPWVLAGEVKDFKHRRAGKR
jgi:hypothetical protein